MISQTLVCSVLAASLLKLLNNHRSLAAGWKLPFAIQRREIVSITGHCTRLLLLHSYRASHFYRLEGENSNQPRRRCGRDRTALEAARGLWAATLLVFPPAAARAAVVPARLFLSLRLFVPVPDPHHDICRRPSVLQL